MAPAQPSRLQLQSSSQADDVANEADNWAASPPLSRSALIKRHQAAPDPLPQNGTSSKAKHWLEQGYSLRVVIKSVINLDSLGMLGASPDPYVQLRLGAAAYTTRIVFRNKCPVFEERCVLPLQGLQPDAPLVACVYDYDAIKDQFIGQAQVLLSTLLSSLRREHQLYCDSIPLTGRDGQGLLPGELQLEACVISPEEAAQEQAQASERPHAVPALKSRYAGHTLVVHVRAFHGLRTLVGAAEVGRALRDLQLELRVGGVLVRVPVSPQQMVVDSPSSLQSTLSLLMDDKVEVPLCDAFVAANNLKPGSRKQQNEMGDVRLFLMAGNNAQAKAQIPLWCVPQAPATPPAEQNGDSTAQGEAATAAADAPQVMRLKMERYTRALTHPVHVECTMQVVPNKAGHSSNGEDAAGGSGGVQAVGDEDEEDVSSAAPLADDQVPPPLSTPLLQEEISCGPCRLYQLLVSSRSSLMERIFAQERLTEVCVPEWSSGEGGMRTRTMTYKRPLSVPVGPKEALITELQTLRAKAPGGWVFETRISTSAPKGDSFVVLLQAVARRGEAPGTCSLRVSMQVDFIKSCAGFIRAIIQKSATADSKQHWVEMVKAARVQVAGSASGSEPGGMAAGVAAAAAAGGNVSEAALPAVRPAAGQPITLTVLCTAVVLLVLLLAMLLLSRQAARHHIAVLELQLEAAQAHAAEWRQHLEEQAVLNRQAIKAAAEAASAAFQMCSKSTGSAHSQHQEL